MLHIWVGACHGMVSQHLPMFGVHWSSGSGDIINLKCNVTSQELVIEGSFDIKLRSSSLYVTTLPSLLAIGIVVIS